MTETEFNPALILIIDDEEIMRETITYFLEDFGYQIITADNGREGLEKAREKIPDLVMLDLKMPGMDGFEVLSVLQKDLPETGVIIISGTGMVSDAVRALRLGAWDFILKPIQDMSMLKHSVDKVIERRRLILENMEYRKSLEETNDKLAASLAELEETQYKLIQSEKMSALGNLVAGFAHEINTPIGVGVTAVTYLQSKVEDLKENFDMDHLSRSALSDFIDTAVDSSSIIHKNLNRAVELVSVFKKVGVDQASGDKRKFNLGSMISDLIFTLQPRIRTTPHSITLDCPDGLEISSYPGAFSQFLANLVMNSLTHAFDEKPGEMKITVRQRTGSIELVYKDNGRGIPEDVIAHIFEPFFTTNRQSGGSGLGLYIVYNIITQRLDGTIECFSRPGEGVEFTIVLPV